MWQKLFFEKVAVLTPAFCKIFRSTFFYRTPLVAASDLSHILQWLSWYYNFYFALFLSTMSGNALIRKEANENDEQSYFSEKVII